MFECYAYVIACADNTWRKAVSEEEYFHFYDTKHFHESVKSTNMRCYKAVSSCSSAKGMLNK